MKIFITISLLIIILISQLCANEMRWEEPINVFILNSEADDFAPAWNKELNILYFNSNREKYSYFYTAKIDIDGEFLAPQKIKDEINVPFNNQSYISFENSNKAILTTYRQTSKRPYLNLYQSFFERNSWSKPILIESLASDDFSGHSTVSPCGKFMIFSSTRSPEHSDTDLWIAYKQLDGSWDNITNLNSLNSPGNEISPFLKSEDTLFFASNGHSGPGGYEIFVSIKKSGNWQRPYPLVDINTEFDESDFSILPNGDAIFASNRPSSLGQLDLYLARKRIVRTEEVVYHTALEISLAGTVSSIRSNSNFKYSLFPIFNYINYNSKEIELIKETFSISNFTKYDIAAEINSAYIYSPRIIAERLKANPSAKLKIIINQSNNPSENQSLFDFSALYKDFLLNKIGIEQSRISIENSTVQAANASLLISSDYEIFSNIELGKLQIDFEPSYLELFFDSRPSELLTSFTCFAVTENSRIEISSGNNSNAHIMFDLNILGNLLFEASFLNIVIEAIDRNNLTVTKDYFLSLSHKKSKQKQTITQNGKSYDALYLPILNEKLSFPANFLQFAISELAGKAIELHYSANISQSSINEIVKTLSNYFLKITPIPNANINEKALLIRAEQ